LAVKDAKIFILSLDKPEVETVAAKNGKIVALGTEEVSRFIGESTRGLSIGRKLFISGSVDAHCHLSYGGQSPGRQIEI
jgi:predicted amidohydrolase YtcJ